MSMVERVFRWFGGPSATFMRRWLARRSQLVPKGLKEAPESTLRCTPLLVTTRTSRVPPRVRDAEIAWMESTLPVDVVQVAPASVVTARAPVWVTPAAVDLSAQAASRSCGAAGSRAHVAPWSLESITPEAVVAKTRDPSGAAAREVGSEAMVSGFQVFASELDCRAPSYPRTPLLEDVRAWKSACPPRDCTDHVLPASTVSIRPTGAGRSTPAAG